MRFILIVFFLSFKLFSYAQFLELGAGGGIMNYSGDLVRGLNFNTSAPAFTLFCRMNLSEIITMKVALVSGTVKGSEVPIDAFAVERSHSFSLPIYESSLVMEYHFLDFRQTNSAVRYSPYLFGGFGVMRAGKLLVEGVQRYQPVLPMGGGFKHLIAKKYTIGLEAGARKTFFDYLDGISDGDLAIKNYQYGNPNDDDWYFFINLSFSITIFNIPCPFPYIPNSVLLED